MCHGPEFVAKNLRAWLGRIGVKTLFIERPSEAWLRQDAAHGRMATARADRDERLAAEAFSKLHEAKVLIEQWRRHYNAIRPHSSLGCRPPAPETILPAAADLAYASLRPAQKVATRGRALT